jgi:hypothetical protein
MIKLFPLNTTQREESFLAELKMDLLSCGNANNSQLRAQLMAMVGKACLALRHKEVQSISSSGEVTSKFLLVSMQEEQLFLTIQFSKKR